MESARTSVQVVAAPVETGVIGGDRKQAEYTVEELFRRIRRIEKLTRMIGEEGQDLKIVIPRKTFDTEINSAAVSVSDKESMFGRSQRPTKIEPLSGMRE